MYFLNARIIIRKPAGKVKHYFIFFSKNFSSITNILQTTVKSWFSVLLWQESIDYFSLSCQRQTIFFVNHLLFLSMLPIILINSSVFLRIFTKWLSNFLCSYPNCANADWSFPFFLTAATEASLPGFWTDFSFIPKQFLLYYMYLHFYWNLYGYFLDPTTSDGSPACR